MQFVTTKTPLRISFVGGGTDFEKFYKKHNGSVISSTINKFIYVSVKKHSELYKEKFRLNYSKVETVSKISSIKNDITRECLKLLKINFPTYISTVSDIPTSSGLGSSSAFTVGLLLALHSLKGEKISREKLAEEAFFIESKKIKRTLGKQDQYAVAFGGLNKIIFKKNNKVEVSKIKASEKNLKKLSNQMFLIWTKQIRSANKILRSQNQNIVKKNYQLNKMKNFTNEFNKVLKKKTIDLRKFSDLINLNWEMKKTLSKKIYNKKLSLIYSALIKSGSIGTKLLGAGGGGFFLSIVKKSKINFFKKKIKNKIVRFEFEKYGSKIIYKY